MGDWGKCCDVLIHGQGEKWGWAKKFHRWIDLTDGCIALTNDEVEEIFNVIRNGTIIEINP